jgi:DNA-binding transcriptional regulator YhcF (GntR family)
MSGWRRTGLSGSALTRYDRLGEPHGLVAALYLGLGATGLSCFLYGKGLRTTPVATDCQERCPGYGRKAGEKAFRHDKDANNLEIETTVIGHDGRTPGRCAGRDVGKGGGVDVGKGVGVAAVRLPFRPVSAVGALADALRRRILSGEPAPGTPLPGQEIAAAYGVARPTVREAPARLVHEGLPGRERNRGAYVPEVTVSDLDDLMYVRGPLEDLMAQAVAGHRVPRTRRR